MLRSLSASDQGNKMREKHHFRVNFNMRITCSTELKIKTEAESLETLKALYRLAV